MARYEMSKSTGKSRQQIKSGWLWRSEIKYQRYKA
jgi:hypothetical protein